MTIREILERLCNNSMDDVGYAETHEEEVIQAEQAIKKAVIEGLPPERKGRFVVGAQDSGDWIMTEEADGYNTCLKDIKESLR
jgi:hypothetical protein